MPELLQYNRIDTALAFIDRFVEEFAEKDPSAVLENQSMNADDNEEATRSRPNQGGSLVSLFSISNFL
jgi:hypothetical protein